MMWTVRLRAAILAALLGAGLMTAASAQTTGADPHHPDAGAGETSSSEPGGTAGQGQTAQPTQPGMMGQGMMGQGMMGGMMQPGTMGAMATRMHGHMMKIMFAVADEDGDGGLSFEEVTTIHKRIFDTADSNKDGKVTPEEIQSFMRE